MTSARAPSCCNRQCAAARPHESCGGSGPLNQIGTRVMGERTFTVKSGAESRHFNAAFYKFIELRGWSYTAPHGHCSLKSSSTGRREIKTVSLCSEAALADF